MSIDYILIGLLIGFLSGLFGIGGSIITTPILKILLGIPDLIALASPLPVTIPAAIAGSISYKDKHMIHKKIALLTILGGLPTIVFGAMTTKIIPGHYLMIITGIFVLVVALLLVYEERVKPIVTRNHKWLNIITLLIGISTGFFSGLIAIGGGFILVPAYIMLLGLTIQEAAATSLICVAFFAIPGTMIHALLGHIDWLLVLHLCIGVIPGSYMGAHVALKIKSRTLQYIFTAFLCLLGIYFILMQMERI